MVFNLILLFCSLFIVFGILFGFSNVETESKISNRLRGLSVTKETMSSGKLLADASRNLVTFGAYMLNRQYFSGKDAATLRDLVISAGYKPKPLIYFCIGGKFFFMAVSLVLGMLVSIALNLSLLKSVMVAGAFALVGSNLIGWGLNFLSSRYRKTLMRSVSDMLDMMVICAEAGLTLETLIARVAGEIGPSSPEVAKELDKLSGDLRVSSDRKEALMNFGRLPSIEPFQRLAVTLIQSSKFGTPLSDTLRTLSAELRREMITAAEEKAGRLPAILTVPMIIFILPSVFCLLIGPAALRLMHPNS